MRDYVGVLGLGAHGCWIQTSRFGAQAETKQAIETFQSPAVA